MPMTKSPTAQPTAIAEVVASMAANRERISFLMEGDTTYVYGHNYGGMDRIASVSVAGEIEWIA